MCPAAYRYSPKQGKKIHVSCASFYVALHGCSMMEECITLAICVCLSTGKITQYNVNKNFQPEPEYDFRCHYSISSHYQRCYLTVIIDVFRCYVRFLRLTHMNVH